MNVIKILLALMLIPSLAFGATVSIEGGIEYPYAYDTTALDTTQTNSTVNADGERTGCVFIAPSAITIGRIGFLVENESSWSGTVQVRVETVDSSGVPTGTEVGTGTSFTPTNGWQEVAMTSDATLTAETYYFVGTRVTAYTSGSFQQARTIDLLLQNRQGLPFVFEGTGSSTDDRYCTIAIYDASDNPIFIHGMSAYTGNTVHDWATTTNPDRRGVRFKVPFPTRVVGVRMAGEQYSDFEVILFDSDGSTQLANTTVDASAFGFSTSDFSHIPLTPSTLTKDTWYRLVINKTTGTNRQLLHTLDVDSAADMDTLPGGQEWHYTAVDGVPTGDGDWTNTTTSHPMNIRLILDQLDDGAGGGGSSEYSYGSA